MSRDALREGVRQLLPIAATVLKPRTEPVPREELLDEVAAVYLIARLAGEDPVAACVEGSTFATNGSELDHTSSEGGIDQVKTEGSSRGSVANVDRTRRT